MQSLISNLIRPFRFRYSLFDLGPKYTDQYQRHDANILNDRGYKIQYSYYQNKHISDTCLVYAHCNSGCRVEGLQLVQPTIEEGWNLCLFDFVGSGISEGEFISLGFFEAIDLQTVISLVLGKGNSKIHLWGRSMGAATIILYLEQTKQIDSIISCVLDSPYSSLWRVIKQYSKSKINIPEFITQHLMEFIRRNIIRDHQFDIKELELGKKIQKIEVPVMLIASTHDTFVSFNHATELYKCASSKYKVLEYIDKQHNSPRQASTISLGLQFMHQSTTQKTRTRKQLKFFSKKPKFYQKINGYNMAQLIIKSPCKYPKKKLYQFVKHQLISSTGHLHQYQQGFYSIVNNKSKDKLDGGGGTNQQSQEEDQKAQTQRYPQPKKKPATNNNTKNPHILQQSIIKLTLPPELLLPQLKTVQPPHHSQQNLNNYLNNIPISSDTNKFNVTTNPKSQQQIHNSNETNQQEDEQNNSDNKQNNSNINNNYHQSENNEDIPPIFNAQIKNFNSITKRNHFNQLLSQQSLPTKQPTKLPLSKTISSHKNLTTTTTHPLPKKSITSTNAQPLTSSSKMNSLFHLNNHQSNVQSKKSYIKYHKSQSNLRERINTYNAESKYQHIEEQSIIQNQMQKEESMCGEKKYQQSKVYSSHSDISVDAQQKISKIITTQVIKPTNIAKSSNPTTKQPKTRQYIKRMGKISEGNVNGINIWQSNSQQLSQKPKKTKDKFTKKRHFQSNQDISYLTKYFLTNTNQILPQKPPPQKQQQPTHQQPKDQLQKTQKTIKIELDSNILKINNCNNISQTKRKPSIKCINTITNTTKYQNVINQQVNRCQENKGCNKNEKNNKSMNDCPSFRIGHNHHQINGNTNKMKNKNNKKNHKINAIEISHHSFL